MLACASVMPSQSDILAMAHALVQSGWDAAATELARDDLDRAWLTQVGAALARLDHGQARDALVAAVVAELPKELPADDGAAALDAGRTVLRPATPVDLSAISAIYDHYAATSTCTWGYDPIGPSERGAWFSAHGPKHPVLVATRAGHVVGWGALSIFNPRAGYAWTVEDSVYVRAGQHRLGLGRLLLGALIAQAEAIGHHAIVAGISADQAASLGLHRAFGFFECGRLPELGRKFDRWLDLIYMVKRLP